jgi:small-conductance mechanosensitive channel
MAEPIESAPVLEEPVDREPATDPHGPATTVDVAPGARDSEIAGRLNRILAATNWFDSADVRVEEGVVFLQGTALNDDAMQWASNLARRTEDVVAVVNQMKVAQPTFWTFKPALEGVKDLWHDALLLLPFLGFGIVVLVAFWLGAKLSIRGAHWSLRQRVSSALLRDVLAYAAGFLVMLLGVYIVLRISGLTRLALTVVGGTGILGLVIGIAFRDITENFLASIFLSMRRPYLVGDLVEIADRLGYVQRLTTRSTILMTLSGNHVEIPNSTVYKSTICNFSASANRREDFTIGVGYDAPLVRAQELALSVLRDHPAVLKDPEPWALVDKLGSAVVELRVYFWLDGRKHSWLKVRSSVIRLVKRAFQDAGIELPDEAREIIFPRGIPLEWPTGQGSDGPPAMPEPIRPKTRSADLDAEPTVAEAEGDLESEANQIEQQARKARPAEGENLL